MNLCKKKKCGYPICIGKDGKITEYLPIIAFCDNFWILAKSPQELQIMSAIFFDKCKAGGWLIPLDECAWTTTASDFDERWKLTVDNRTIERRSRDDGFKALGCIISADGHIQLELHNRFCQAWNSFFKHAETLCSKTTPIAKRIDLLKMVVEPSLFWCAGSWHLNCQQRSNLRGLQRAMIMKMMGPKRRKDEHNDIYFPRLQDAINEIIVKNGWLQWDLRAKDFYFRWAGQVSRTAARSPDALTCRALHLWNIAYIKALAVRNNGRQGHGRRLHVWRWEADIFKYGEYCEKYWESLTTDISEWHNVHLETFRIQTSTSSTVRVWGLKRSRADFDSSFQ